MFKSIHLTNFRKHTDKYIVFTDGVNIIRGSNEQGKSTIFEGMLYALFGSSALKETIADVVTYGLKEAQLKVVLVLEISGVDYTITRSTAGAEILYADQSVTGQTATKTFMENLLGASMQTSQQLMFARQSTIKGVLSENGAANGLVEKLANLEVIENLVDGIQSKLPSGNLNTIDQQIATLTNMQQETPEKPTDELVQQLTQEFSKLQEKIDLTKARCLSKEEVAKAKARVDAHNSTLAVLKAFNARKAELEDKATIVIPDCHGLVTDLEVLRAESANEVLEKSRLASYNKVFPKSAETVAKTYDQLVSEIEQMTETLASEVSLVSSTEQVRALKLAKRINETTCAFCKKDLSDVAEVVTINSSIDDEVAEQDLLIATHKARASFARSALAEMKELKASSDAVFKLMDDNWSYDDAFLPPTPIWQGPIPQVGDATERLKSMEAQLARHQRAVAAKEAAQEELAKLIEPHLEDVSDAIDMLAKDAEVVQEYSALLSESQVASHKVNAAKKELVEDIKRYEAALASQAKNAEVLAQAVESRKSMIVHNELIKKLRAVRPKIAAKMWGTVQGAISHYFSAIRQTNSVVERTDTGFTVNGRSIKGLSGSTEDALGLAIRISLSKLFIPWVSVLLLDESFSACDDGRELAGISTLAGAGFGQIILVTHSDAPESIANNLIVL